MPSFNISYLLSIPIAPCWLTGAYTVFLPCMVNRTAGAALSGFDHGRQRATLCPRSFSLSSGPTGLIFGIEYDNYLNVLYVPYHWNRGPFPRSPRVVAFGEVVFSMGCAKTVGTGIDTGSRITQYPI